MASVLLISNRVPLFYQCLNLVKIGVALQYNYLKRHKTNNDLYSSTLFLLLKYMIDQHHFYFHFSLLLLIAKIVDTNYDQWADFLKSFTNLNAIKSMESLTGDFLVNLDSKRNEFSYFDLHTCDLLT